MIECYSIAAEFSLKLCEKDLKLWELVIYKFAQVGKIKVSKFNKEIYLFIPTCFPQLSENIYELVLSFFMNSDLQVFNVLNRFF
jgi:hypothetical protein